MALFKSLRGKRENLPSAKTDGYAYFCTDDGTFWIDYKDENSVIQRKQLNAKEAELLSGASLSTSLASSDANVPTSKAVKQYVDTFESGVQTNLDNKVDKEIGKGLSSNDYTSGEKTKLSGIAEGAQANVIEEIQVNGTKVAPSGKKVNISVPTGALANKSEVAKTDLAAALKTEIEGKVNSSNCGDIISHNASEFAVANHNHKIEDLTQTDYIIFNCGSSSTVI